MSNSPKLQKARISNREMARDTKQLVESGVQMCDLRADQVPDGCPDRR